MKKTTSHTGHERLMCRVILAPAKALVLCAAFLPSGFSRRFKESELITLDCDKARRVVLLYSGLVIAAIIAVLSWQNYGAAAHYGSERTDLPELSAQVKARPFTGALQALEYQVVSQAAQTGSELVALLKDENLWDAHKLSEIPPVLIQAFPHDLAEMGTDAKKKAFIHSLLPIAMVALNEVKLERGQLLLVLDALGGDPATSLFDVNDNAWQRMLSQDKVDFILNLCAKYRTHNGKELLTRVNVLPASLVIAQGAMESSWGGSRFAREANNLFGMWTWGKKGLIPSRRDAGKNHKIAIYDSILESVRAYVLTINRIPAYAQLREVRNHSMDPLLLSEGLIRYSEKGEYYVADIKKIIRFNKLTGYDKLRLIAG